VVCFTDDHDLSFARLAPSRVRTVIDAWADRTAELSLLADVEQVYANRRVPDLPALDDDERDELAVVYVDLLRRLDSVFNLPMPYIAAWHQAPVRVDRDLTRLHLRLFSARRAPHKLKYLAGSESAMGAFVNDIRPEHAAELLRAGAGGSPAP
jgi:UDPglucose--hexose-1-phosphate uridylyltransferase